VLLHPFVSAIPGFCPFFWKNDSVFPKWGPEQQKAGPVAEQHRVSVFFFWLTFRPGRMIKYALLHVFDMSFALHPAADKIMRGKSPVCSEKRCAGRVR